MAMKSALLRWLALFVVWIGFAGTAAADLIVGALAAAVAAQVSLSLLPAAPIVVAPLSACRFAARLAWQSLRAGIEVARLALGPRANLHPGFIDYPMQLPAGPRRDAFRALISLQPGSLPVTISGANALVLHCLDISQPVAEALAREEAALSRMLGRRADG